MEKATFETVWAALQETDRLQKENAERQKETDRIMRENAERQKQEFERRAQEAAERQKEFERRVQESEREKQEFDRRWQKTERYLKRLDKELGIVPQKFGKIAKRRVVPDIFKRFNELGYHFSEVSPGGERIFDEKTGKTKTEIGLLLASGEAMLAVEVKETPALKDIERNIKQLEILRDHRRSINDQRKVLGAIAGAIFGAAEKQATAEAGLYVIEQSGDTMKIDVPDGFVPRVW